MAYQPKSLNTVYPKGKLGKLVQYRREKLPYGFWIDKEDRMVLFNRDYDPIWRRASGASDKEQRAWEKTDHYVVDFKSQFWFYGDVDCTGTIKGEEKLIARLEGLCHALGFSPLPTTALLTALVAVAA